MYKRLASLLSSKRSEPYSTTINWIRCRIGFALLRSMIMCLREADSFHLHFIRDSAENCDSPMDLAITEGRIYTITSYLQPQCNYCDCTIVLYCVAVDVLFYHRRTSMVLLIEVFLVLKGICSPCTSSWVLHWAALLPPLLSLLFLSSPSASSSPSLSNSLLSLTTSIIDLCCACV